MISLENSIFFINYIIIPLVLILGIITTIEDFKVSKIRNKWIKWGIVGGLIYYLLMILITIFGTYKLDRQTPFINQYEFSYLYFSWQYYLKILLNTGIAFILAFGLWLLKVWPGGDAKLFTLYAFLIPLSFYDKALFSYWPALNLMVNIFLPIAFFLSLKMLAYPFRLGWNYLKTPHLLKEYFIKQKSKHQIDKKKIWSALNTALSFLVILVLFQLLRTRMRDYLDPYLGSLVTASYFLIGFVIFKPLRTLLKGKEIIALIILIVYLLAGYVYFPENIFADLHKVLALQMILMMSYFYIFKYGKALGLFLYNATEVNMVPVEQITSGLYINKSYIKNIMGNRFDYDKFKTDLTAKLDKEEGEQMLDLIKKKASADKEKQQYRVIGLFRSLSPHALPRMVKEFYKLKKEKDQEKALLAKIENKLDPKQKEQLNYVLKNTDEISEFLKSIKGKLTKEQAEQLKKMLEQRSQEIAGQGHPPIKHIILHKTFSFAPFMFLGVIITLITKSNLIHIIYQLFGG